MSLKLVIPPRVRDLGEGFTVRRALPYAKQRMVGPFIFWDHMGPATLTPESPMAVRPHPHIGLSTLTYLFEGESLHRDSLGNELVIGVGEVNWMTAGEGITHSERTVKEEAFTFEGLQLWIALPKEKEKIAADFQHVLAADLPQVTIDGTAFTLVAGEYDGQRSPVNVYSDLVLLDGLVEAGQALAYRPPAGFEAGIYVAKGAVKVAGELYSEGNMILVEPGSELAVEVVDRGRIQFFGGKPFEEARHIWWNFVASDLSDIEQAKRDWSAGKFKQVINETEFIPLPKM